MSKHDLDKLFNPKSIAVIGASNRRGSVGYILLKNITSSEFEGVVYPINIKAEAVQGIKAYPTVADVPGSIDCAVIAVPAKAVPDTIRQCGEKGIGGAVVITAGFKEAGPEGLKLETEMKAVAEEYGIRILGPNCLGYARPPLHINTTFSNECAGPGRVAFISQSGALGTAILDWAKANNIGFSAFVSAGSMTDVDFGDMIDYFGDDPHTSSIIMYIESIQDARSFMSAARHFSKKKPIIVVKSGRTARSAMAAASHTGALAGDDTLYSAVFRRAGVVRVDSISDLFDSAESLSRVNNPKGNHLAIITNAGGPGVMASDRLIALGGELAELTPETDMKLKDVLTDFNARGNPVDIGGDAPPERFAAATQIVLEDENTEGVLAILTPQATSDPTTTAKLLVDIAKDAKKPLLTSFMGEIMVGEAIRIFREAGIPVFATPEDAVVAYMNMYEYTRSLDALYETPTDILPEFEPDRDVVKEVFAEAVAEGRTTLSEFEAKRVLDAYQIPTVKTVIAQSAEEAEKAADEIGFPIVMKIHSNDITHKSDVGGIALNIRSAEEAGKQFDKIIERVKQNAPDAEIIGVTVQEMSRGGHEVIVGAKQDPTFGPSILFGMGGTGVELFRDVAIDFPPLNQALAHSMIQSTKVSKLLAGYRGSEPVDMEKLERTLVKISYLMVDFPEISEMDINPLQVRADGLCALDARIMVDPEKVGKDIDPGSHLILPMYPSKYVRKLETDDGEIFDMRPIRPEDESAWAEMIATLSPKTAQFRFFEDVETVTKDMLVRYCHTDYDREIAMAVFAEENGKKVMVGVGRLVIDPVTNSTGTFAILVHDNYQNKGIGTALAHTLTEIARDRGLTKVSGQVRNDDPGAEVFANLPGFEVLPGENLELRVVECTL